MVGEMESQDAIRRLQGIEIQNALLLSSMESFREKIAQLELEIERKFTRLEKIIIGNEKEGLRSRVSKVEDTVGNWKRVITVTSTGVIAMIVKVVFDLMRGAK